MVQLIVIIYSGSGLVGADANPLPEVDQWGYNLMTIMFDDKYFVFSIKNIIYVLMHELP